MVTAGDRSVYEGVICKKRQGILVLSAEHLEYKATDDAGDAMEFKINWGDIENYILNKATSAKAMMKMTVKEGEGTGTRVFQLPDRDELELLRAEIHERKQEYESPSPLPKNSSEEEKVEESADVQAPTSNHNQAAAHEPTQKREYAENPPVPVQETVAVLVEEVRLDERESLAVAVHTETDRTSSRDDRTTGSSRDDTSEPSHSEATTDTEHARKNAQEMPPPVNSNGSLYGKSDYLAPFHPQLVVQAHYEDFAPCPCLCCVCLVNDKMRKRTYLRLYENRIEESHTDLTFCCCTTEKCVYDNIWIRPLDKPPSRMGMCCHVVPVFCCGPPVVFTSVPPRKFCGLIDCRPCFGETIRYAPCNLLNLRCFYAWGPPCYHFFACPLFFPIKNGTGDDFLAKWKGTLQSYNEIVGIDQRQVTIFARPKERICFSAVATCCNPGDEEIKPAEIKPDKMER